MKCHGSRLAVWVLASALSGLAVAADTMIEDTMRPVGKGGPAAVPGARGRASGNDGEGESCRGRLPPPEYPAARRQARNEPFEEDLRRPIDEPRPQPAVDGILLNLPVGGIVLPQAR